MNYYVLVEGDVEYKVLPTWITTLNPTLVQVHDLSLIQRNNFFMFSGGGYPFYKTHNLPAAIEDANNYNSIDKLVLIVDSEEIDYEEKLQELLVFSAKFYCRIPIEIIIEHFCIECWGLANQVIVPRQPRNHPLIDYLRFYNVIDNDPELLPAYAPDDLERVEFAYKYLHKAVNDRNPRITYSKHNPLVLTQKGYFEQLCNRYYSGHLQSFKRFIEVFQA